jgi:tRNA dimethylallyltransferase
LLEGVSPIPPIDPQIRQGLLKRGSSQEALYADLQRLDPVFAQRIHPHDRQRTMRGLEVYYGTEKPLSHWQAEKPVPAPYDFETILLMPPKEDLYTKIAERIDGMLSKGVVEEIAALLTQPLSPTALKAIGLREFGLFLEGRCSLEEAKALTIVHSCQYAKRQRTWFRHQFKG